MSPIPVTAGEQPFSIEDAWAYPYTAGAPGSGLDIPGIIQIAGDPQNTVAEHRGDNTVLAKSATRDSIDLTATVGVWNQAAIAGLCGGTATTAGTTPNQTRSLSHKSTDSPADVGIQVQTHSKSADGGGTRLIYPRCQSLNMPPYGMNDQDFNDLDIDLSAVAAAAAYAVPSEMVRMAQFETFTALTSTWTAP